MYLIEDIISREMCENSLENVGSGRVENLFQDLVGNLFRDTHVGVLVNFEKPNKIFFRNTRFQFKKLSLFKTVVERYILY